MRQVEDMGDDTPEMKLKDQLPQQHRTATSCSGLQGSVPAVSWQELDNTLDSSPLHDRAVYDFFCFYHGGVTSSSVQ